MILELWFLSLRRLVDQRFVDVRDDTSTGNGGLDQSIQFFITSDGKLQMARCDTLDFEILAGISSQLQNFGGEVFQNSRGVYSSGSSHSMTLVHRILQETMDTTDGKLKAGLGTSRLRGLLAGWGLSSFSSLTSFSTFARLMMNKCVARRAGTELC